MALSPNTQLHLVNSMEDVGNFFKWLSEDRGREVIGLDIESTGLSAFKKDVWHSSSPDW